MKLALIFFVGFIIGATLVFVAMRSKSMGNLIITNSESDNDIYLFLELEHMPKDIYKKKRVTLNVKILEATKKENNNSRK